jgi:hypothetical protein
MAAVGLATVALAVSTAGLSAVAHADSSCTTKWRFDGYTELRGDNGGTLTFDSSDPAIHGRATEYRTDGTIAGGDLWADPNHFGLGHFRASFNRDGVVPFPVPGGVFFVEDFDGGVDANGFAHGTQVETMFVADSNQNPPPRIGSNYITSWRSAAPLKCADAPPKPPEVVLTPEEGTPLPLLNAPSIPQALPPEALAPLNVPSIPQVLPPEVVAPEPLNGP